MEKDFEKLFIDLETTDYRKADIAIANCPDNWKDCSLVISAYDEEEGKKFIRIHMNRKETMRVKNALVRVIKDMDCK